MVYFQIIIDWDSKWTNDFFHDTAPIRKQLWKNSEQSFPTVCVLIFFIIFLFSIFLSRTGFYQQLSAVYNTSYLFLQLSAAEHRAISKIVQVVAKIVSCSNIALNNG